MDVSYEYTPLLLLFGTIHVLPEGVPLVSLGGRTMLFLLGLFLGCVLGIFFAGLCTVAMKETPNFSTANSTPEAIEGVTQ